MNQPVSRQLHDKAAAGMQALQQGDLNTARNLLAEVAPQWPDASIWVALAQVHQKQANMADRLAALKEGERREPANLRVRIALGDYHHDAGDTRTAQAHYVTALKFAPNMDELPPSLHADMARAQQRVQENASQYEEKLRSGLADGWDKDARATHRFAQSLDILLGKTNIYLQEPTQYYFPGLPQIQFYEREQFSWVEELESHTDEIRAELQAVLREGGGFEPYLDMQDKDEVLNDASLVGNPDWGAYYFWKNGAEMPENMARCPKTSAALRAIPDLYFIPDNTPGILFSRLKPQTRIPPHNGLLNTRLIAHLPLIVPPGCGFRVGNETRQWEEGKVLIFDDSIEHEAWNSSGQTRVILLFEIHRPEISAVERDLVAQLFQGIGRNKNK